MRTEINPRFLLRMGLVGLFCFVWTGLCLKDGLYSWPEQQAQAQAYLDFQEANATLGQQDLFEEWKNEAAERGWSAGVAGKQETPYGPPRKDYEINQQFYMGGFTAVLGLIFLGRVLLNRGCWIEADEEGLRTSEKRAAKFEQVTELNKKKWQNKGIAKLHYESDGRRDTIVLDDCNYDRETTNEILRHVEAKIGVDKITHGKPEKAPQTADEAAPAAS